MLVCAMCAIASGAASAGVEDTVWNAQKERAKTLKAENAKRLRELGVKDDVAFFAVPALSDLMRLDDTWPDDGTLGGTVRCVLAQDEFEACSFELFSFSDIDGIELKSVNDISKLVTAVANSQTKLAAERLKYNKGYESAKADFIAELNKELKDQHPDVLKTILEIVKNMKAKEENG